MKKLYGVLKSKGGIFALLNFMAFVAVVQNISVCCAWVHHQPKVPDCAKKLRKF